jgi:ribosomal protein S18 acetylase RimI-like enzyme
LARAPIENVFLQTVVATGAQQVVVARDPAGAVRGVVYDGPHMVLAVDEPEIAAIFAPAKPRRFAPRMIVGPRQAVEQFWARARRNFPQPSAIRASQPLYAVRRGGLRGSRDDAPAARAGMAESGELATHAARMSAGELGGNPARVDTAFRKRIRGLIEGGRFWRVRESGALVFQCYLGPQNEMTVQVQGVWSPPEARGCGRSQRAFGAICDLLLDEHPALSLFVNDFNTKAIALYERVGFERVGEFASILF